MGWNRKAKGSLYLLNKYYNENFPKFKKNDSFEELFENLICDKGIDLLSVNIKI